MSFRFVLAAATGAMLAAASPASASYTINFGSLMGSANPFSTGIVDGNTVTFDSPSGANTFFVEDPGLYVSFGAGLGDYLSSSGDTLTLTFAHPILGPVTFPFGIEDASFGLGVDSNDFVTAVSNTGVTIVANGVADGTFLDSPEGTLSINAPGATVLTITSGAAGNLLPFAIGNVTLDIPEPISLSILGVGLAGLTAVRRRRA
jgi:hypothetical protein